MSDCAEVKKLLSLDAACCDSCHEDDEEYGYPLCEIGIAGNSYWVCCYVQQAAFTMQTLNGPAAPAQPAGGGAKAEA